MANLPPFRRRSPTGHFPLHPQPPAPATSNPTTTSAIAPSSSPNAAAPVHPSFHQPRIAIVLDVTTPWHPWLFALRLVSVIPALWWGLPSALQLLFHLLPGPELVVVAPSAAGGTQGLTVEADARQRLPHNAYLTAGVISLAGGFQDPRLLLPGWIGIATTLNLLYCITHQKINIGNEPSTSINVSSMASFLSMETLLAHMHLYTPDYPQIPSSPQGGAAGTRRCA
ncbi:hypothetical protein EDB80DRAFT_822005 [Ilyonectria destructans]|nr:hypothetical protein EDB80DRAFT_822005 [Ilyonectria destructans]